MRAGRFPMVALMVGALSVWAGPLGAGPFDDAEAYWSFDNGFTDATGNHDGTAVLGASIVTHPYGGVVGTGALKLAGPATQQYMSFGDLALAGPFSLAAWVRPENIKPYGTGYDAVLWGDGENLDWIRLETGTARMKFDNSTKTMPSPVDNGSWQHVVVTRDASGLVTLFHNGQEAATMAAAATNTFKPDRIGCKGGNYFEGLVDEAAVWTTVIDQAKIDALYAMAPQPAPPSP